MIVQAYQHVSGFADSTEVLVAHNDLVFMITNDRAIGCAESLSIADCESFVTEGVWTTRLYELNTRQLAYILRHI